MKLRNFLRRFRTTLIILVVVIVAIRAVLPIFVQRYVNRTIDQKEDYAGSIGDVDLNLWRGAYEIENVRIFKTSGEVPVPFIAARQVDLSIQWSELLHGSLVGEVVFTEASLNFVDGPTPEQSQKEMDREWAAILEDLFPFKLNKFVVRNGEVHFARLHQEPPVDVYLKNVSLVATNFTNARKLSDTLVAGIVAQGEVLKGGEVKLAARLNPMAKYPTFDLAMEANKVNLVQLNDFLRAYGKFDVESGIFSLAVELAGKDGSFNGYLKPVFDNLDVLNFGKERKSDKLTKVFWEALVEGTSELLENQPKDRLAARIPVSGRFDEMDVHVLPAIVSLLRNGFIRALMPGVEGSINFSTNRKQR